MKKLLALILALAAVLTLFTGCGTKPADSDGDSSKEGDKIEEVGYTAPAAPRSGVFEPFGAEFFNNGGFNVPGSTFQPSRPDTKGTRFEPVEVFKNVYFIGDTWVCCLLYVTDQGNIVMWDALEYEEDYEEILLPDMQKLGLDPAKITTVFLSHGHFDHIGLAGHLESSNGAQVYIDKGDEELMLSNAERYAESGTKLPENYKFYEDGQTITVDNTTWTFTHTPGHTAGSTSFLLDVVDFDGNPHKLCCWGGTSAPRDAEGTRTYLDSVLKYREFIKESGADSFLSMHPFVDYSVENTTAVRESGSSDALIKTADEMDFFMQGLYVYATGKGKLAQDGISEFTNEGYNCRVLSWPYLIQIPEYDLGVPSIFKDEAVDAKILDDVYLIGNGTDATLVFDTTDGIVLIDAMTSNDDFTDTVLPAMQGHGLDPAKIQAVYLTHGHADKYGFANYLKETYGAAIYMSDADKATAEAVYADAVAAGKTTAVPDSENLAEGAVTHGQFTFNWYATPGHTKGTMSFTVNVSVNGKEHVAALWGGGEYDYAKSALEDYLASIDKFIGICEKAGADVLVATHPYFNYSVEKIHDMSKGDAEAFVLDDVNTNVIFALKCIKLATQYKLTYYSV